MEDKILLVDDEADIREVLSLALSDMGYRVLEAENGLQALEIFSDVRPALVLTDIKMPGMDGIELLKRIKHENPETEVIMITGHGDMDLAVRSLKNEATDFITKPINVDALEIAVQRARDRITIRRQLREYTASLENLVREKTQLQDHLTTLGLMISSISHGLKGLLTGLDGGIYLVESGFAKKDDAQIQEGWNILKVMADRIRKMVLDILYYAKERKLETEPVDVLQFAGEVAATVAPRMKEQDIEFQQDFDADAGKVEMDAGHVNSALLNIIENAIDACRRDSSQRAHRIVFGVHRGAGHLFFEVTDNGIGMDSETREKLFTPFFSSKGSRGTGLGLFIANKIIEQHGGKISVKSAPGQGSSFRIAIPLQPGRHAGSGDEARAD